MKHLFGLVLAAASLLLAGCATTINSEVTAFHAWPADLKDKSFVFAADKEQNDSLEYRNYEQLIRNELLRLGFTDAKDAKSATLKVTFQYGVQNATMVVTQPVYDPFWYGSGYGRWGAVRPWGPVGPGPFYDPLWGPPLQQTTYPLFQRLLHVAIERAANAQKLYEVTVESEGRQATLPMAMPYMVRSAFSEFPGPSGVPRHVRLKLNKPGQMPAPAP
jgi:hypothetical protein